MEPGSTQACAVCALLAVKHMGRRRTEAAPPRPRHSAQVSEDFPVPAQVGQASAWIWRQHDSSM